MISELLGINIFKNEKISMTVMVVAVYLVGNIAFAVFDFALTRILNMYFIKFRKNVRKALRINSKI